jgi:antirestriction protein ArdC
VATVLSVLTDPKYQPIPRHGVAELIAALAHGNAPWHARDWLASIGALPPNFAPTGRPDAEEAFYELFAATGMDRCGGPAISFYCQFDDTLHMTSWTEEKDPTYHADWIHELVHATGHASRLGRDLPPAFGPNVDEREDLIAEIASAIVCLDVGFQPRLRHPECLGAWTDLVRADRRTFSDAVAHARAAAGYLFECRDAQAALFEIWDAAERAREQAEEAGWAAERRSEHQRQREAWALRCTTGSRPGELPGFAVEREAG